jgi:alpha-tubulin suppressor-like RCC1 family protein
VAGGLAFFQISAGEGATCGLVVSDSGLYCWGTDLIGINAPPGRDWTRPTRYVAGRFRAVSMGYEIACALRTDGQALCWGYGALGQLGNGDSASSDIPVAVAQPGPFDAITTGHAHACGRTSDGTAWCWGSNASGQLGVDSVALSAVPLPAAAASRFDSVSAHSAAHTCALVQGAAWCWGSNGSGRLGDGGGAGGFAARPVAGNLAWRQVSTGFGHTCGLTLGEGHLYCWGDNSLGQLGTGGVALSQVPLRVLIGTD